jgi:hypothetical protein
LVVRDTRRDASILHGTAPSGKKPRCPIEPAGPGRRKPPSALRTGTLADLGLFDGYDKILRILRHIGTG